MQLVVISEDSTPEEIMDALFVYKDGGEIGIYTNLPGHSSVKVLVTTRMGYYALSGSFKYIHKPDHEGMLYKLINAINKSYPHSPTRKPREFPSNLKKEIADELEPYLNNKWVKGSFGLVHIKREVYADINSNEFVRVTTGKRQSIFDGEFNPTTGKVTVVEWLRAVDDTKIVHDGKLVNISDVIKLLYGKPREYKLSFRKIIFKDKTYFTLTGGGTLSKHTRMKYGLLYKQN